MTIKQLIKELEKYTSSANITVDLGYDGQGCPQALDVLSVDYDDWDGEIRLRCGIDWDK